MRNICVVSGSRADKYLLNPIAERLEAPLIPPTLYNLIDYYRTDLYLLLGDRFEILECAFNIIQNPKINACIAHMGGGEVTAGSKDELYRHAITKLSHIHLAATQQFADRIIRMGENPFNVFNVGSPGCWRVRNTEDDPDGPTGTDFVITLHPNTIEPDKTESEVMALIDALKAFPDVLKHFYAPNMDEGREIIERKIRAFCELDSRSVYREDEGDNYLYIVKNANCVIGNSSAGIIEAPSLRTPTVNIGDRQKGRPMANSVLNCEFDAKEIKEHIESAMNDTFLDSFFKNPYDGGEDTIEIICDILQNHPISFAKEFND